MSELVRWRELQEVWPDRLGEDFVNEHGLVFTTKTGRPISKRNIARSFERARKAAGVEHGTLKTLRSTVATRALRLPRPRPAHAVRDRLAPGLAARTRRRAPDPGDQ